jgi:PAS domain S-box-containing protein
MGLIGWGKGKSAKPASKTRLPANLEDETLKFKVIIDSIDEGVIVIDAHQVVRVVNPAGAALCGWKPEEATGIDISTVLKLVDEKGQPCDDASNPLKQIFETGVSQRGDNVSLQTRDSRQFPVSIHVSPLLDDNKQVAAAVAVFSDVSKERAAEQQRADFVSTASHEMRTPVAAIEGYLALALNEKVATIDTRARQYLEKASASTHHLGELFQDLLTSAKAEDGRLTSHPTVVELGEFLDQLSSDLRLVAENKGLALNYAAGNGNVINATGQSGGERVVRPLYYVYVDADRLREVITNLFDNAVKYTDSGTITLGLAGNDQVAQCYVRDTGPGIPEEDIPHLFQKFYRVDNSATRTIGGTGLGLFICRKIVELYNGRIWAESKINEGSTFYINLPRLTTQKADEIKAAVADAAAKPINPEVTA